MTEDRLPLAELLAKAGDDKTLFLGIRPEAFHLADEGLPVKVAVTTPGATFPVPIAPIMLSPPPALTTTRR